MTQTGPEQQKSNEALRRLANDWSFSTETAFRIPELLAQFSKDAVWFNMRGLTAENVSLVFTRRVLVNREQQTELEIKLKNGCFPKNAPPMEYEWTGAKNMERFVWLVNSEPEKARKSLQNCRKNAEAFFARFTHDNNTAQMRQHAWNVLLHVLKNTPTPALDRWIFERLSILTNKDAPVDWQNMSEPDLLINLKALYSLYSHLPHTGYVPWHLTELHFAPLETELDVGRGRNPSDSPTEGRPKTLAYFFNTKIESHSTLPIIKEVWRIDVDGQIDRLDYLGIGNPQEQGHFFSTQALPVNNQLITELFFELFQVFNNEELHGNERANKNEYWQLILPVYLSSTLDPPPQAEPPTELTTSDFVSVTVAGPFLGWLHLDLQRHLRDESPSLFEEREYGTFFNDKTLYKLRGLRFLLNQFAKGYLAGEMEWALEQDWGDTTTPEIFVRDNIYHCSGWVGTDLNLPPLQNNYFAFYAKDEQGLQRVATNADYEMHGPDATKYIRVNLTLSPALAPDSAIHARTLDLERRSDTALPRAFEGLLDYGSVVARSVRHFYERASLIQAQRDLAKGVVREDFAHQIRHLAGAIGDGWLVFPHAKQKVEDFVFADGRKGSALLHEAPLVPIPMLYYAARDLLSLWSVKTIDQLNIADDGDARSITGTAPLAALTILALKLAQAEWLFFQSKEASVQNFEGLKRVLELCESCHKITGRVEVGESLPHWAFSGENAKTNALFFVRTMEAAMFNWLRHGEQSRLSVKIETPSDQSVLLSLRNSTSSNSRPISCNSALRRFVETFGGKVTRFTIEDSDFVFTFAIPQSSLKAI